MSEAAAPQPQADSTHAAPRSSAGGAAASGGEAYQRDVAAWFACHILAEEHGALPLELPADVTLANLWCQAPTATDDVVVETSSAGVLMAQAKRRLDLGTTATSEFAGATDQLVRQILDSRSARGSRPWERPLDHQRDRLVLIVGPNSSAPVRQDLREVLAKVHRAPQSVAIASLPANADETAALNAICAHVARSWERHSGSQPTDDEMRSALAQIHVLPLEVEAGGTDERHAKALLRSSVLHDPEQADTAWNVLGQECSTLAASRAVIDGVGLRELLHRRGIRTKAAPSYQADISRLQTLTNESIEVLRDLSVIRLGDTAIKLDRPVVRAVRDSAESTSLLVTGEPGSGKSGALHDLCTLLRGEGRDVVVLLADRHAASTLGQLRADMQLEHDLVNVLQHWTGSEPGFLVVDALDAARAEGAANTIRNAMGQVQGLGGRWRVVASVRQYDLRYNEPLKRQFAGTPVEGFSHSSFRSIAHAHVPLLTEGELAFAEQQSADLQRAVEHATPQLRELLLVPFNLRLLAEIVAVAGADVDLGDVYTDLELLERYWRVRVIRDDRRGDGRENVIRAACEVMISERRMTVPRAAIARDADPTDLHELLSANVLREWHPAGARAEVREVVLFSHHAIFDFAAARLFRGSPDALGARLEREPDLVLMIQPSLRHHLRYVWWLHDNRRPFWELSIDLAGRTLPAPPQILGPAVAASLIRRVADVEPLLEALQSGDAATRERAERCVEHLTGALLASDRAAELLSGPDSPWPAIVERLSAHMSAAVAYSVRRLLQLMIQEPKQ